jgi:asparagine synthetase B (glutamine-hydrolysing)
MTRVISEAEFRADPPRIIEAMDQPTIKGINIWFMSKAAPELGWEVALAGLNGNELFGGCCAQYGAAPRGTEIFGPRYSAVLMQASGLAEIADRCRVLTYGATRLPKV